MRGDLELFTKFDGSYRTNNLVILSLYFLILLPDEWILVLSMHSCLHRSYLALRKLIETLVRDCGAGRLEHGIKR